MTTLLEFSSTYPTFTILVIAAMLISTVMTWKDFSKSSRN